MGQHDQDQTRAQADQDTVAPIKTDQGAKTKPTSGAQADRMLASLAADASTAGAARLSPLERQHDFGEQVVGSHHTAQIRAPWNLSEQEAVARFSVSGDGFELVSAPTMTLPPSRAMGGPDFAYAERGSPTIVYNPKHPGTHAGTLTVSVGWNLDGHIETQTVALQGRARSLDQAPGHETTAAETTDEAAHAKRHEQEVADDKKAMAAEKKNPGPYNDEFNTAVGRAEISAASLARAQNRGLAIVKDETAAYHKLVEKAPRSIWWDLAEIALTVATAGVASHVAKGLLPRLLASQVTHDVPVPGGATMTEVIPAKISEFTTDAIKEGIKQAGKKAIQALGPGADHGHDSAGSESTFGHSSNAQIDFFAQQKKILDTQEGQNSASVLTQAQHLRPLLHSNPDQAVMIMDKVQAQLDASAEDAEQQQANAVAPQWATFVARMSLGTENVSTAQPGGASQQAVRTEALRPSQLDGAPHPVDGVLDVFVENARSPARVSGATLHGASQSAVDRIGALALSDVKMPVRFVLGPRDASPAIVTRDEAGRVRVQGAANEADAVKGATEMVDQILSRSLASWGVAIKSDDDSGHRG
jgi:hypothetical protein